MFTISSEQRAIIKSPLDHRLFLSGAAGCGKTTAGVERMLYLLGHGIPADELLVLTPQRTLAVPYLDALHQPGLMAGGQVKVMTVGGLARRSCELFWPLAADAAGFAHPDQPPVFLTLETAQYYMAHLVHPLLNEGYFESVTIDRNRLYSQILDNLNKSAVVGFPHTQIGARLDSAWNGDAAQRRVYADAQESASRFREFCLAHNLLDFSLQLEIFWTHLWPDSTVKGYLTRSCRHLIYDNLEEEMPRALDLLQKWLPSFNSALLIYDLGGGFRRFLGADPDSAWTLREICNAQVELGDSFVMSGDVERLAISLGKAIVPDITPQPVPTEREVGDGAKALAFPSDSRFYPQMLDWVAEEISRLVSKDRIPPSEIVVLAPYLSDSLRFSLLNRLESRNIPARSHRPSRSLRDEPAAQALLTLATLAHPNWEFRPSRFDIAYTFMMAIEDMDLVRAQLLAEIVYRQRDISLSPFEKIRPEVQERITFVFGQQYSALRNWLLVYREAEPLPLDHFLQRLFGELLSQPGFGFHRDLDSARVAATLVESVFKFRRVMKPGLEDSQSLGDHGSLGKEYITMLQEGVIAAQYLEAWRAKMDEAVLVAPAHTFLMMNRPAAVQFWLDPGSGGWTERLFQPLTHPYVLSRQWEPGRIWSDADEVAADRQTLARLSTGLLHRCRSRLYLGLSDLGESGFEQRGPLLKAFQRVLQGKDEG